MYSAQEIEDYQALDRQKIWEALEGQARGMGLYLPFLKLMEDVNKRLAEPFELPESIPVRVAVRGSAKRRFRATIEVEQAVLGDPRDAIDQAIADRPNSDWIFGEVDGDDEIFDAEVVWVEHV